MLRIVQKGLVLQVIHRFSGQTYENGQYKTEIIYFF